MSAAFASSSDSKMKNVEIDNNSNKITVDSVKKKSYGDTNKKSDSNANNSTVIKVKSVIPRRRQDLLKWYGWGYKDSMFKIDKKTASFTGNR